MTCSQEHSIQDQKRQYVHLKAGASRQGELSHAKSFFGTDGSFGTAEIPRDPSQSQPGSAPIKPKHLQDPLEARLFDYSLRLGFFKAAAWLRVIVR